MALPYVPADDVEDIFNRLIQQADQNAALQNLLEYGRKIWIDSNRWNPTTWSVYRRLVQYLSLYHLLYASYCIEKRENGKIKHQFIYL